MEGIFSRGAQPTVQKRGPERGRRHDVFIVKSLVARSLYVDWRGEAKGEAETKTKQAERERVHKKQKQ